MSDVTVVLLVESNLVQTPVEKMVVIVIRLNLHNHNVIRCPTQGPSPVLSRPKMPKAQLELAELLNSLAGTGQDTQNVETDLHSSQKNIPALQYLYALTVLLSGLH